MRTTVLFLVQIILVAGCATTNPDLRTIWNKMGDVRIGMTRQEVYTLVDSPQETEPQEDFVIETWEITSDTGDYCYMQAGFDSKSRLISLEKRCSLPR